MNVVVLAGGLCDERDVSLTSGSLVANALIELGHHVFLLDVYEGTKEKRIKKLFQNKKKYEYSVDNQNPNLKELKKLNENRDELIGPNVLEICKSADIVFNALHGSIGENGKIQAVFDTLNIKYTGTNHLGSTLAMNKNIAKQLLLNNDIKTPKWKMIKSGDYEIDKILKDIKFPIVVKPNENGSSVGVSIVYTKKELYQALTKAFNIESSVLIEEYIEGREFSVGVLGEEVLPPIEIIPKNGFYDYENKYQKGLTLEMCPADITKKEEEDLKHITSKVHQLLNLGVYSRIDMIVDKKGEVYCLEANTLPGMTPTSLLPQEAQAIGISYNELVNKILELSMEKYLVNSIPNSLEKIYDILSLGKDISDEDFVRIINYLVDLKNK